MTRLGSPRASGRFDLAQAFRFLGMGPSNRELGLAIDLLREAGAALDLGLAALAEIATANGSNAFVALDLATAWSSGIENLRAKSGRGRGRRGAGVP